MRDMEFFKGIQHVEMPWGDKTISAPQFFYDTMSASAHFLAPVDVITSMLPSERMIPIRVWPGKCIVSISLFEYRDCDLGPYNEIGVVVPVTIDKPTPMFTGVFRNAPSEPYVYVKHLPVTTEDAKNAGVEFANYPKTIGDIQYTYEEEWVHCSWKDDGVKVMDISIKKGQPGPVDRTRMHAINADAGRLVRVESIVSERQESVGTNPDAVKLSLGEHPVADDIRKMQLGKCMMHTYSPQSQLILSPVMESWSV